MKQIIPFAHDLLTETIKEGSTVVDATLGNGHDSLFLSQLVGQNGQVIAFDIQKQALEQSQTLFQKHDIKHVDMVLKGHEYAGRELKLRGIGSIDGVIFNLGFLPGSDKEITTSSQTTIQAIEELFPLLHPERYIVMVVYPGHAEGRIEKEELINYLASFPAKKADIVQYHMINRSSNAPFVIAIYKK